MRIRMKSDAKGALTSTDIREHQAGREYDLPADLAEAYLSMGVAEAVAPEPAPPADDDTGDGDDTGDDAPAAPATPAATPPAQRKRRGV